MANVFLRTFRQALGRGKPKRMLQVELEELVDRGLSFIGLKKLQVSTPPSIQRNSKFLKNLDHADYVYVLQCSWRKQRRRLEFKKSILKEEKMCMVASDFLANRREIMGKDMKGGIRLRKAVF